MSLSKRMKITFTVTAIIIIVVVGSSVVAFSFLNQNANSIRFTLLDNAGVMIEHQGIRIYVDPINLDSTYGDLPADAVLITHPHGDHYQGSMVNLLQKEGTVNIFPENMSVEISVHDGIGVNPEDQLQVGHITITAFYMYTFSLQGYPASHPEEANWTSYIIDINGFVIFHAGDSKNIPEYYQLTGEVDLALLPLGPGCQTMANEEVVQALNVIEPRYFIPIHYAEGTNTEWIATYGSQVTNCQIISLSYWQATSFIPP